MNEKLLIQDIIDLLCEKHLMERKDAEFFTKGMFDLIKETLTTENYVKIKGLGTFKLTEVDARETVHVNTGERIEIQGHTKVSFTPDSTMKELINKPFAHFETVVLNEGVELEDTPIEVPASEAIQEEMTPEAMDVSETLPATEKMVQPELAEEEPIAEKPIAEEPTEEPIAEEPTEEPITEEPTEEPITEEPIVEEVVTTEEPIIEEATLEEPVEEEVPAIEPEEPVEETPTVEPQPEITETKEEILEKPESIEEKVVQDTKEKSINRILWGVIVVLVLIILFGAYWMFFRSEDIPEVIPEVPVQEEQAPETAPVIEEKPQEETLKTVQFIEYSAEELRKERVPSLADTLDYQIVGTQEEYTLQKGETIIRASVRFFGTKKYWPYIVKHNMDVLPDPDNIPAGIRIKIPILVERNK